ncbi:unnamed protein product [Parnassius apollo]|uniref:(apollo) hypothetical protein n=1 Tax=Parnassius apollo TaxID=110799 RepID=A0A8S3X386_PARAO|nr:unnamed protein product [Parnassius apollo]
MKRKRDKDRSDDKIKKKIRKLMKKVKKLSKQQGLTSESDSEVSWPEEMENDSLIEREKPEESESPQSELQILGNLNSQASTSESGNQPDKVPEVQDLDAEALAVLGEINIEQEKGPPLHPEIANRWTPILSKGLKKEDKRELMQKYMPFENVPRLIAPTLNPECISAISASMLKRDTIIKEKQKQIAAVLTAIGSGLESILKNGDKIEIIRNINDASKLLCDYFQSETNNRKILITNAVNHNLKETLKGDSDMFLFGTNLAERIKNAKIIQRSGKDLKEKQERLKGPTKTLNWRGPPQLSTRLGGKRVTKPKNKQQQQQRNHCLLDDIRGSYTTVKFDEGMSYGSLNSIRSALSLLIGSHIGINDQIKRLFKGFYRLRPNNPKYQFTWNVSEVFNYLELHQMDTKDVKFQTKKTAMLFALATGQRAQTLASVEIDKIKIENDKICITISKLLKTSGPYRQQPLLVLPFF